MTDVAVETQGSDVVVAPSARLIITRQEIVTDDGTVKVDIDGDIIRVEWFCGDIRSFGADDLVQAISHIESMADISEVDLALRDNRNSPFAVKLVGGTLYVGERDEALVDNSVPWKPLRKALRRALKNVAAEDAG